MLKETLNKWATVETAAVAVIFSIGAGLGPEGWSYGSQKFSEMLGGADLGMLFQRVAGGMILLGGVDGLRNRFAEREVSKTE